MIATLWDVVNDPCYEVSGIFYRRLLMLWWERVRGLGKDDEETNRKRIEERDGVEKVGHHD